MVTKEKLIIYKKYDGNIENWDRFGKRKDRQILTYEEFELIDSLVRDLKLIEEGLISEGYKARILATFNTACPDQATKEALKSLVGRY